MGTHVNRSQINAQQSPITLKVVEDIKSSLDVAFAGAKAFLLSDKI
jgi:hypothetical protein